MSTGLRGRVALARGSVILALAIVAFPAAQEGPRRTIAITIDDLPGVPGDAPLADLHRMTTAMIGALDAAGAPAVGFVNGNKLEVRGETRERRALLERWAKAGVTLGNHTYSHPDLNVVGLEAFTRDVIRGEAALLGLGAREGPRGLFFRHPFTHTGPTADVKRELAEFLAERGYVPAPFTIENADYLFNTALRRAAGDRSLADRIVEAYLAHTSGVVDFAEHVADETFDRPIPQVLLIHVNDVNASALGRILERLSARGYTYVRLIDALGDPAYGSADGYVGAFGPSWLHRWRIARGLPSRLRDEPDPPAWVIDLAR